jgi:hypothetical protein
LIVEAKSVKNTDSAGEKGYEADKKATGIKRHIPVDSDACTSRSLSPRQM